MQGHASRTWGEGDGRKESNCRRCHQHRLSDCVIWSVFFSFFSPHKEERPRRGKRDKGQSREQCKQTEWKG